MQNNPYQHVAKEFMDLWQKQISSVISDKQFIQAMLEMFQSAQNPSANSAKNEQQHPSSHVSHTAAADHGLVAELAFRLAMCEKRIVALERQIKKSPAKRKRGATKRVRSGAAGRSSKPRQ